jgi:hypothetical protein
MGRGLNGGAMPASEPLDPKVIADQAFNDRRADTLGRIGASAIPAYEATLPDDDGTPAAVTQPKDVQRFDGALFSWVGGSNYTDNPEVVVQRRAGRGWRDFADMSGEIPVTLAYPAPGARRFVWTASFEAFVSRYALGGPRATPAGTYRFVVDGAHRTGGKAVPYRVTSREFSVSPWPGVTATTELLPDRRVAVTVGPRRTVTASGVTSVLGPIDFPDTYKTPVRFVREQRTVVADPANPGTPQWYCNTCSFRPWADTGDAASVTLLFTRAAGGAVRVPARREGDRWISSRALRAGESAVVPAGGVVDAYGDFNGASSAPAP